jgi:sRNA-binding carbon storage regulator CsrA
MLIKTMNVGETLLVEVAGQAIVKIQVVSSSPHKVQFAIDAPGHIRVQRPELTDPDEAYKVIDLNKYIERKKNGKNKR